MIGMLWPMKPTQENWWYQTLDFMKDKGMITNVVPSLNVIGNKYVEDTNSLSFTVSATDFDGDALTYSANGFTEWVNI